MTRRLLLVLSIALLALAGCTSGSDDAAATGSPAGQDLASVQTKLQACPDQGTTPAADSSLPDVSLPCFSGGTLDLAKAPGVPMVVNLWASWCPPCRTELPVVQQLADEAGSTLRVTGLVSKDGVGQAASFADDAGATFPSAFDADGDVMTALGIRNLPYTYFITADGTLAYTQVGPVASLAQFEKLVSEHLGVQL